MIYPIHSSVRFTILGSRFDFPVIYLEKNEEYFMYNISFPVFINLHITFVKIRKKNVLFLFLNNLIIYIHLKRLE